MPDNQSGKFDDPIPLPDGGQLVTLRDAGNYIAALPKRPDGGVHSYSDHRVWPGSVLAPQGASCPSTPAANALQAFCKPVIFQFQYLD